MIETLPNSLMVQYSELMQNCVQPVSDGSNLSFKYKDINKKRYWYLYISIGKSRREHYLGEETTELLDRIDDEKALWQSNTDDRKLRTRLVDMLIGGGMPGLSRDEGRVLALLERNGIFLAGAALVDQGQNFFLTRHVHSLCASRWLPVIRSISSRLCPSFG